MSTQSISRTAGHRVVRRLVARVGIVLTLGVLGALALAGSASADEPLGWNPHPVKVNLTHAIIFLGGIPLLMALVIVFLVYLPSIIRGDRLAPGSEQVEDQWLGGPARATAELAAPDTEQSKAGGASGRW